jgi:hypothetical protein
VRLEVSRGLLVGLLLVGAAASYALPSSLVSTHVPIPAPKIARPLAGRSVTDPEFGTKVTRITGAAAAAVPGIFPYYSRRQAFNADETRLLLATGDGGWRLYDAATLKIVRTLDELDLGRTETFWHPTDPQVLLFRKTVADDAAFFTLNVETKAQAELYRFADYDSVTTTDEGRPSEDGRALALLGQTFFEDLNDFVAQDLLLVDGLTGAVKARIGIPDYESIDWVCASPSGAYVVLDYVPKGASTHSIAVYDADLRLLRPPMSVGEGHSDLGVDAQGREYLVIDLYDFTTNSHKLRRFELSDGTPTTLLTVSFASDMHVSCVNAVDRDWCFVSTFDDEFRTKPRTSEWFPFENEIFALRVDGSGSVRRLAHHRSRAWYATKKTSAHTYEAEPHATVSRSADRVVFGSNWSMTPGRVSAVDAYVVDLRSFDGPPDDFTLTGPALAFGRPKETGAVQLTLAAAGEGPFKVKAIGGPPGVKWSPAFRNATPGVPVTFTWKISKRPLLGDGFATFVTTAPGGRARITSVPFTVY